MWHTCDECPSINSSCWHETVEEESGRKTEKNSTESTNKFQNYQIYSDIFWMIYKPLFEFDDKLNVFFCLYKCRLYRLTKEGRKNFYICGGKI